MATWLNLSAVPMDYNKYCFIILKHETKNVLYAISQSHGLLKYSFNTDSWTKQMVINQLARPLYFPSFGSYASRLNPSAINSKANTIYFISSTGSIAKLQIKDDRTPTNWEIINPVHPFQVPFGSKAVILNNTFHIIGGYYNNYHVKWNDTLNQFETLHNLNKINSNQCGFGLHQVVKIKNKLILFGGREPNNGNKILDRICEYDINNNFWYVLDTKLPTPFIPCGCISILHDQYVLLMGVKDDNAGINFNNIWSLKQDDIWIYSVRSKKFKKSDIKCPRKGAFDVAKMCDRNKDELIVYGFVRNEWKISTMQHLYFPPHYLIQIMHQYYLNESVHLFDWYSGKHWKMNTMCMITADF